MRDNAKLPTILFYILWLAFIIVAVFLPLGTFGINMGEIIYYIVEGPSGLNTTVQINKNVFFMIAIVLISGAEALLVANKKKALLVWRIVLNCLRILPYCFSVILGLLINLLLKDETLTFNGTIWLYICVALGVASIVSHIYIKKSKNTSDSLQEEVCLEKEGNEL